MSDEPVPVAVIGAGNMGSNHIRVYDQLPGAELVEVVEKNEERAKEIVQNYDVNLLNSVNELEQAEAATIALPNHLHTKIGIHCIEQGMDVLIEKPLAENVTEAQKIVDVAHKNNAILQVGHIERFNPAVESLKEILEQQELVAIEAHRLGPFNEQLSKENVVLDLMIHDLDIVDYLSSGAIKEVTAMGTQIKSDIADHVVSQIQYENGEIASLTASHVTHGKVRTLTATTDKAYIKLDYQSQDITVQRRGSEYTTDLISRTGYVSETVTERPYIPTQEPLKIELRHFLECIEKRESPSVNGDDGIRALEIVSEVTEKI